MHKRLAKKILQFGWDRPLPHQLRSQIRVMEEQPFDGVIFCLPEDVGGGKVFDVRLWDQTAADRAAHQARQLDHLRHIAWDRFTDNYIMLYAVSAMDWFDDRQWARVLDNVRWCARAAREAGCKGLYWDSEPYGANPWRFTDRDPQDGRSFEACQAKIRERGAEFVRALADEFPEARFPSLRNLSEYMPNVLWPTRRPVDMLEPGARRAHLEQNFLGLAGSFVDGWLDAAPAGMLFDDGNEDAYFYVSEIEFYRSYHAITQRGEELVAPENVERHRQHVRVGQAVYLDYVLGLYDLGGLEFIGPEMERLPFALTLEQRLQWFEHQVYYGLQTADRYVWIYNEMFNWWGIPFNRSGAEGQHEDWPSNAHLIPAVRDAIRSARRKYEAAEPLGFSIESMLSEARERVRHDGWRQP